MNWGVVCKPNAKNAIAVAKEAYALLGKHGTVCAEESLAKALHVPGVSFKEMNKQADVVVTVGGDGTILMTLSEIEKPVFAINSGGMGFLSEIEARHAREGLDKIIAGKYNIEERAKLKVTVDGTRLPDAANEVTVQTARIAKILYMDLFVDGEMIESMGADGVIIATPTGSTSYSLSVGGPILDPSVDAMVIAPLAAFKLSARPWIVPLNRKVSIKIKPKSKDSKLVIDGRCATSVSSKNDIVITRSEKKARFVRFGESFYEMVRLKLMR